MYKYSNVNPHCKEMYINKYDKNNIQTSGNDDTILVLQIRNTTSNYNKSNNLFPWWTWLL